MGLLLKVVGFFARTYLQESLVAPQLITATPTHLPRALITPAWDCFSKGFCSIRWLILQAIDKFFGGPLLSHCHGNINDQDHHLIMAKQLMSNKNPFVMDNN